MIKHKVGTADDATTPAIRDRRTPPDFAPMFHKVGIPFTKDISQNPGFRQGCASKYIRAQTE
jgi:hypothetical protein